MEVKVGTKEQENTVQQYCTGKALSERKKEVLASTLAWRRIHCGTVQLGTRNNCRCFVVGYSVSSTRYFDSRTGATFCSRVQRIVHAGRKKEQSTIDCTVETNEPTLIENNIEQYPSAPAHTCLFVSKVRCFVGQRFVK